MWIRSGFDVCGQLPSFPQSVVREELNFSGSIEHARRSAGPITRAFVEMIPPDLVTDEALVVSLMHWFKKGWSVRGEDFHFDGEAQTPGAAPIRKLGLEWTKSSAVRSSIPNSKPTSARKVVDLPASFGP